MTVFEKVSSNTPKKTYLQASNVFLTIIDESISKI